MRLGFRNIASTLALAAALAFPNCAGIAADTPAQKPAPAPTAKAHSASELAHRAQEQLNQKDFAGAAKSLEALTQLQPQSVFAWFNLAYAYTGLHSEQQAEAAYRKTLELDPKLFAARLNLGILLLNAKQSEEALGQLSQAVALKPTHARAHFYYARALAGTGKTQQAEQECQEALRLDPHFALAHFELGQLRLNGKDFGGARDAFQQALQLNSELPQAQLGMALALEGLKQPADAAPYFERYLAARPQDLETRFHLARLYLQEGKEQQALDNLQKVEQGQAKLPGWAAAMGDAYTLMKKYPEAEKYYRQAVANEPGQTDLHRALGQCLLEQKKFAEAETEFRAALRLDSKNNDALRGLATSVYLQKRYSDAIPLYQALEQVQGTPPGVYFLLATCYDHLRALPQALENYQHFLDLAHGADPDQEWQARQRVKLLRRELRK